MIVSKKLNRGMFSMEKIIITGTILMVSLMMPYDVMADVTYKVSGNVTIEKHKEGDQFTLRWPVQEDPMSSYKVSVSELDMGNIINGNGTFDFEITCDESMAVDSKNGCVWASAGEENNMIQMLMTMLRPVYVKTLTFE